MPCEEKVSTPEPLLPVQWSPVNDAQGLGWEGLAIQHASARANAFHVRWELCMGAFNEMYYFASSFGLLVFAIDTSSIMFPAPSPPVQHSSDILLRTDGRL